MTPDLERAGIVLVALLAGALLALPLRRRERVLAQLATLVLTPALLALTLWNNPKLATLHHHPARGVAAVVAVLVVVAALAFLIDRRPALLPLLALLALPFRIPLGSVSNGLLLPLYAVIAARRPRPAGPLARSRARRHARACAGARAHRLRVAGALRA